VNNVNLLSERFERAAYSLKSAMEQFPGMNFTEAINQFERSVDKLARIYGMQAENDQRKVIGASMAYDEASFINA
jgi:hypothetical protein